MNIKNTISTINKQYVINIVRAIIFLIVLFSTTVKLNTYLRPDDMHGFLSIACLPLLMSCLLLYVLGELVIERKKKSRKYSYLIMLGIYFFYLINIILFFKHPEYFLYKLLLGKI